MIRILQLIMMLIGLAMSPLASTTAAPPESCATAMNPGAPNHDSDKTLVGRCCAIAAALPVAQPTPHAPLVTASPIEGTAPPALTGIDSYGEDPPPRA